MSRPPLGPTALLLLVLAAPAALGQTANSPAPDLPPLTTGGTYTTNRFFADLKAGRVERVTLDGAGNASVYLVNTVSTKPQSVVVPPDEATLTRLREARVPVTILSGRSPFSWVGQILPLIVTALILLVLWRTLRGATSGGAASNFGKSKAA
ncbi:ATP-dependent metalloprotease FtsH, partial [Deinococcus aerius]